MGIESADDAAVYKVSDELAMVTSIDFFPPIVDDPRTFGVITAANAVSDIYAMGAVPKYAVNIVCFPRDLGKSVLGDIMKASAEKLSDVGVVLAGGHSIEEDLVLYGLSVTGFVHPDKVITNSGAEVGDKLILTKPLGTGVVTSAMKGERIRVEEAEVVLTSMKTTNKAASEAMVSVGVNACTDITGFGLVGHALELACGANVTVVIYSDDVPMFDLAMEHVGKKSNRPRSIKENMEYLAPSVETSGDVDDLREMLLYDPQTSGGLLISVGAEKAGELLKLLEESGVAASVVGEVSGDGKCMVSIK